ncbi:MAG: segregation/condensation protein A [Chloroflexi bacterium]|nr:segregation/condensation protein A [Chloroflexota bacterium]
MATISSAPPSLDGYQLRLPTFEGPLDVLLRLIERDQLSISDISLLAVFDQFIEYVNALESSTPEFVAEFVTVAGRLSVLKSRALLPRPVKTVDEPDEIDLVRQLEEYRAVKVAAALLASRQQAGAGAFGRGEGIASPLVESARFPPQPPSALTTAVSRWLTRLPLKPVLVPAFRVVSLREMVGRITSALTLDRQTSFDDIRGACAGRQETAVAFLAVLTLMRRRLIDVTQNELFGPITLSRSRVAFDSRSESSPWDSPQTNGRKQAD